MYKKFLAGIAIFFLVLIGLSISEHPAAAGVLDFLFKKKLELFVYGKDIYHNEQPIILRGVAVGDPHSRQTNDKRTVNDYETIKKDWSANVVRLSVHPGAFRKDEERTKKFLEKEVEAARKQGLYVIIDWHVIGTPNGWYKPCKLGEDHYYSYSSNFNTASDFWKYAANKYRGDTGVIFELWNEPADEKNNVSWVKLKPYLERLYGIIKGQGADNLIIAPGVWWTYDLRGIKNNPIKGDNIAYAWHNYPPNGKYIRWQEALDNLDVKYPIVVTEWGYTGDTKSFYYSAPNGYAETFKKFMLQKNMHFTAWCWHGTWMPKMFENNWYNMTDFGRKVKYLLNNYDKEKTLANSNQTNITQSQIAQNFVIKGYSYNSQQLSPNDRMSIINSYYLVYKKMPQTTSDMLELERLSGGLCPQGRIKSVDQNSQNKFFQIYKHWPNAKNKNELQTVCMIGYGTKINTKRNLTAEKKSLTKFTKIYGRLPNSTLDWNIIYAMSYSKLTF